MFKVPDLFQEDHQNATIKSLTFSEYLRLCWTVEDKPWGTYQKYCEYMWNKAKECPDSILLIFYEDIKKVRDMIVVLNDVRFLGSIRYLLF